ncbi:type VI secretion system tube protein TssD [Flavobacterium branchiarum]|uniref:Type VI secretion system tube protein TssD n=1 Tax=Flavobacterium branchiarum TaxID=1114870 RepID=A0ABV5FG07_9FLAO|nr:type VI secretion system tube protein TssD [Flavobacterium branchiarum]MDN3675291.1 type VI secretion system tube protein TssD [Flavobacterium branchiarum]
MTLLIIDTIKNMATLGILKLDNVEYRLITFNYKSTQPLDAMGKPSGKPTGCLIDLTIESDSSTALLQWTLNNEAKDGIIIFYKADAMSKFKDVEFKKAYCISHYEIFEANGTLPMRQLIRIYESRQEIAKKEIAPPKQLIQQEPEKKIIEIKWMCGKMKDSINEAGIGEKTSFLVKTENYKQGETITIIVDEADGKDLKTNTKEISYSGKVNAEGIAELKEQVKIQTV